MTIGLLQRTPAGRVVTKEGQKHLGYAVKELF